MSQLLHDPVAHWLIVAAAVAVVTGEIVATYLGHAREGKRQVFGSLADSLLLPRTAEERRCARIAGRE